MKFLKKICVAAVATTIFVAGSAQAVTLTTLAEGAYAGTIINEAGTSAAVDINTVTAGSEWTLTLVGGESLQDGDVVQLTLSGGAMWAAASVGAPGLTTDGTTALPGAGLLDVNANVARFLVSGNIGSSTVMQLSDATRINASMVPAGGKVTLSTRLQRAVLGSPTAILGTGTLPAYRLLSSEPLFSPRATLTPAGGTFDVTTGYVELTGGASTSVSAPAVAVVNVNANAVPAVGARRVLLTLSGDMGAGVVSSISTGTDDSLTAATANGMATDPAVLNQFNIDRENDVAWAANTAALTSGPTALTANIVITFNTAEMATTDDEGMVTAPAGGAKDAGSYLLTISGLQQGTGTTPVYNASVILSAMPALNFIRDGSSFVSNTLGPLNMVNITDRSGRLTGASPSGDVTISAYNPEGNPVPCTPLGLRLPNNGTLTISGADIIEACPGAKRIEGFVNSTSILSTNIKQTENGATSSSNLSATGATAAN